MAIIASTPSSACIHPRLLNQSTSSAAAKLAAQQADRVTVMEDKGGTPITWSPSMPPVHAMRNQARNFLAMVRGEREAPCYADEAAQDLAMARDYIRLLNK